jgi:S-adenosylmethionine synthetase
MPQFCKTAVLNKVCVVPGNAFLTDENDECHSFRINFSTPTDEQLEKAVEKVFDCRPNSIIRQLKLTETKYLPVAAYGHIGREDLNVRWEDTDKTEELLSAIK